MPNIPTIHNTLRARMADQSLTGLAQANIEYDNAPFDQPDNSMWMRWHIRVTESHIAELGAQKSHRHVGMATAQIFAPLRIGDAAALTVANEVAAAFRDVTVSQIHLMSPTIRAVGRQEEKWWQVNVNCPFWAFEIV